MLFQARGLMVKRCAGEIWAGPVSVSMPGDCAWPLTLALSPQCRERGLLRRLPRIPALHKR
ncbi:hypothetical protein GGD46_002691 [Rhizobium lusitanum]|uniref:Uncharacterized protein n=1 Tax=Rhizobium lusitanum TaxID=293958 RepID=A0A7X0IQQ3_9HYPH|nr:hypothetical protein [Rhizobium lusitanum]